jgi:uncharacterized protein
MDAAGRFCAGCARTLAEIAAWSSMSDTAKREVWRELARRRATEAAAMPTPPGERGCSR